jgi:hypothetical protein
MPTIQVPSWYPVILKKRIEHVIGVVFTPIIYAVPLSLNRASIPRKYISVVLGWEFPELNVMKTSRVEYVIFMVLLSIYWDFCWQMLGYGRGDNYYAMET